MTVGWWFSRQQGELISANHNQQLTHLLGQSIWFWKEFQGERDESAEWLELIRQLLGQTREMILYQRHKMTAVYISDTTEIRWKRAKDMDLKVIEWYESDAYGVESNWVRWRTGTVQTQSIEFDFEGKSRKNWFSVPRSDRPAKTRAGARSLRLTTVD